MRAPAERTRERRGDHSGLKILYRALLLSASSRIVPESFMFYRVYMTESACAIGKAETVNPPREYAPRQIGPIKRGC